VLHKKIKLTMYANQIPLKLKLNALTGTSTDTSVPSSKTTRAVIIDFPLFPSGEGMWMPDSAWPRPLGVNFGLLPRLLNVLLKRRSIFSVTTSKLTVASEKHHSGAEKKTYLITTMQLKPGRYQWPDNWPFSKAVKLSPMFTLNQKTALFWAPA